MNFTELVNGSGRSAEEVLSERIDEITSQAGQILRKHLEARISVLRQKRKAVLQKQLQDGTLTPDKENPQLRVQIKKIDDAIALLEELCIDLIHQRKKVNIAFGFEQLRPGLETSFIAMRNAECAANMAALNKEKNAVTLYSHDQFLAESIKGQQEFQEATTKAFNGSRKVKDGWEEFCYVDQNGFVRMQPDMIKIYRSLEKFKLSREYRAMTTSEQMAFQEKIAIFGKYYDRINIVDVLKNFVEPNMGSYLEKIDTTAKLLNECEALMEKPGHHRTPADLQKMKVHLEQTSKQLEVSFKDDGEEIIQTVRTSIKALLEEGDKVIVLTDNIGFGAINQSSYEQSIIELMQLLQISEKEWQAMADGSQKREELVRKKLEGNIEVQSPFYQKILSIGDEGTNHLRNNEKRLQSLFGGTAIINADGGDESQAIFRPDQNPDMPTDPKTLQKTLHQFSNEFRVRIAAVLTPFTIGKIGDQAGLLAVDEIQRKQLLQHIFGHTAWGQDEHGMIKDLNARGLNRVAMKVEKTCNQA